MLHFVKSKQTNILPKNNLIPGYKVSSEILKKIFFANAFFGLGLTGLIFNQFASNILYSLLLPSFLFYCRCEPGKSFILSILLVEFVKWF